MVWDRAKLVKLNGKLRGGKLEKLNVLHKSLGNAWAFLNRESLQKVSDTEGSPERAPGHALLAEIDLAGGGELV